MIITVKKENTTRHIEIKHNEKKTLQQLLRENHFFLDAPCGGRGICGKCRVLVGKGRTNPVQKEKAHFTEEELREGWRLSCCMIPKEDCEIILQKEQELRMAVLAEGSERLLEREKESKCQNKQKGNYGIAIDIGTTTLVVVLVDLMTGRREKVITGVNHQRAYGADVIARMQASNEGKEEELQASICSDLMCMMEEAAEAASISPEQIRKIVIAGNTAMCHLLLKYSCITLGAYPFVPVDISLQIKTSREVFGKKCAFDAEVWILPGISAFVGGDITAGILSSKIMERKEPAMLIDLGTNGEMAIGNKEGCIVTSAAAGPAFEGGNITCGMPGVSGAVTHVSLNCLKTGYQIHYETINEEAPLGLCGSGIIDTVYELVHHGLVDENGTFIEPWFVEGFPIAGNKVMFRQNDIREIQMAKSAIRSGIETLLQEAKITPAMLHKVYLAGGFGYGIDVEKAIGIGIFPKEFLGKVEIIGNSALNGAIAVLLNGDAAKQLKLIVQEAQEVNLAMNQKFNELYLQYMFF